MMTEDPMRVLTLKLHHEMYKKDVEQYPDYFVQVQEATDDLRKRVTGADDKTLMDMLALFVSSFEMADKADPKDGIDRLLRVMKDIASNLMETEYQLLVATGEIDPDGE